MNEEKRYEGVEDEPEEEFQPFDPEKISIDTKPVTMDTCLRRLEQETIILNPDFQRNEVWTDEKKCQLIESLMLKIPIPMFYVSADLEGIFYVVDGLQRLSTLRSFVLGDKYLETKDPKDKGNGFRLKKLEFWGEQYDGCTFNDLPVNMRNRILETNYTFTIINPGTPEKVKRNIFKRINTGGEPLKPQEIRHALYIGKSTTMLSELSISREFLRATTGSAKPDRMMDKELILRTLAFYIREPNYYYKNNDMDSFLADTMRIINIMPELVEDRGDPIFGKNIDRNSVMYSDIGLLKEKFKSAMSRSWIIFGKHAFRKSHAPKWRTPINKSLFEVWGKVLGELSEPEFEKLSGHKKALISKEAELMQFDDEFMNSISRDSLKYSSVNLRHRKLKELTHEIIRGY